MVIINTQIHEDPGNEKLLNSIYLKAFKDENNEKVYEKQYGKHNEKIAFKIDNCINLLYTIIMIK